MTCSAVTPSFGRQQLVHDCTRLVQILITSVLGKLAAPQHQGLVETPGDAWPVQHPDHSLPLALLQERVVDLALAGAVQTGGRLVDHQQVGVLQDAARQRHLLPLRPGQA